MSAFAHRPVAFDLTLMTEKLNIHPTYRGFVLSPSSPYEGKRGRHPLECTCSTHLQRSDKRITKQRVGICRICSFLSYSSTVCTNCGVLNPLSVLQWSDINAATFEFDLDYLSAGLGFPNNVVIDRFSDGRILSPFMENRLSQAAGGRVPSADGRPFDVYAQRYTVEVRSMGGTVRFTPSEMTGKGRKYRECDFLAKLELVNGYAVCDAQTFPSVKAVFVAASVIRSWHERKLLRNGEMTRERFLRLLALQ